MLWRLADIPTFCRTPPSHSCTHRLTLFACADSANRSAGIRSSLQPPATKSRAVASPAIRPTSRTVHKSTPERTPIPHNTELYSLSFLSVATPTEVLSRHLSARRILLPFSSAHSSPSELLTVPFKNRHTVSVADRPTDRMKKERKEGRRESFRTATESTHLYLELS